MKSTELFNFDFILLSLRYVFINKFQCNFIMHFNDYYLDFNIKKTIYLFDSTEIAKYIFLSFRVIH